MIQRMSALAGCKRGSTPGAVITPASVAALRASRLNLGIVAALCSMLMANVVCAAGYDLLRQSSPFQAHERCTLTSNDDPQPVMAAGFGYQAAGTSTILVRTYDPHSGSVLTEDSYDLDVHDEGTPTSTSAHERIFAGGVGVGTNGLSQFLLRVYDAPTGKFLWEGQLNLNPVGREGNASQVATMVRPRATVTRVSMGSPVPVRPFFHIRARDPLSGTVLWQDQFAAEGRGIARKERIVDRSLVSEPGLRQAFDFMILAYNANNEELLWQDTFDPLQELGKSIQQEEDHARMLPLWPRDEEQTNVREWVTYRFGR